MAGVVLRLMRDHLRPSTGAALPAMNRVLYLLDGELTVDGKNVPVNTAWHGAGACKVGAGPAGATVLRYELGRDDTPVGATPHRHKGSGIRCLLQGTMALRVEGEPDRVIKPGEAWFESGREPVYAKASTTEPTSFIRCSILPREIRGQSSIMYVDPKDAGSKPRKYTVFVDEPIELP
jgi:hypothetical protein